MGVNTPDIIRKKRDGEELTAEEIEHVIRGASDGSVTDDQVGAWLMAVYLRGMSNAETAILTRTMLHSGSSLDWSGETAFDPKHIVDKHSTGGVGDKVSLALAPALAACGARVPMISGRGLGHTGGTLDKLESIPGFKVELAESRIRDIVRSDVGCVICGQTGDIAPADRRLYSVRDVTATVDSIPLITGSIVCKKAAEGLAGLILDVKVGRAAFMTTEPRARELAESMVSAGWALGVRTSAVLSRMDNPIGHCVGNALEVRESIETLRGSGPRDLADLVAVQGGSLLADVGLAADPADGEDKIRRCLADGSALRHFKEMVAAQGGDAAVVDRPAEVLPRADAVTDLLCASDGFVAGIDAMLVAKACMDLGAGRFSKADSVDHAVGADIRVKVGEKVAAGQVWCKVHHRGSDVLPAAREKLEAALEVSGERPDVPSNIIIDKITLDSISRAAEASQAKKRQAE